MFVILVDVKSSKTFHYTSAFNDVPQSACNQNEINKRAVNKSNRLWVLPTNLSYALRTVVTETANHCCKTLTNRSPTLLPYSESFGHVHHEVPLHCGKTKTRPDALKNAHFVI